MDLKLKDKKVLITGSTAGIGFEMAKGFLAEGAQVVINSRSVKNLQTALEKLNHMFPEAVLEGIVADFRDPKAHEAVIKSMESVDILVNNVGIYASKSFSETTDEDWKEMFQVNVIEEVSRLDLFNFNINCLQSFPSKDDCQNLWNI
mgnify:CR=1 FL=1